MAKIKVAIFDEDKLYRERFADYLMSYKSKEMELSVFSGITYFLDAINVEKYQLFVLGRGYEELLPRVKSIPVPVLVLSEQDYVKESVGIEDAQVSFTSKYQSMEVITHQMYLMTEARQKSPKVSKGNTKLEVVGVFSPVKHEMQMFFSILYAQRMAQKYKTLYVNLMEFSGLADYFGEVEYDLGDVILQLRDVACRPEAIRAQIYEYEGLSYIAPFQNPENVKEITGVDIQLLLQFVVEYTDYEMILLDFGGVMREFSMALGSCSRIFCVGKNGTYYEGVERKFLTYIEATLGKACLEKIHKIVLPSDIRGVAVGENFLEQLKWGEFGDCVREV